MIIPKGKWRAGEGKRDGGNRFDKEGHTADLLATDYSCLQYLYTFSVIFLIHGYPELYDLGGW